MAVFYLILPKDIHTVNSYYYPLFIYQISFEYFWGNIVKLTYINLPNRINLFSKAEKA